MGGFGQSLRVNYSNSKANNENVCATQQQTENYCTKIQSYLHVLQMSADGHVKGWSGWIRGSFARLIDVLRNNLHADRIFKSAYSMFHRKKSYSIQLPAYVEMQSFSVFWQNIWSSWTYALTTSVFILFPAELRLWLNRIQVFSSLYYLIEFLEI